MGPVSLSSWLSHPFYFITLLVSSLGLRRKKRKEFIRIEKIILRYKVYMVKQKLELKGTRHIKIRL
jgi:hypothetical protein